MFGLRSVKSTELLVLQGDIIHNPPSRLLAIVPENSLMAINPLSLFGDVAGDQQSN